MSSEFKVVFKGLPGVVLTRSVCVTVDFPGLQYGMVLLNPLTRADVPEGSSLMYVFTELSVGFSAVGDLGMGFVIHVLVIMVCSEEGGLDLFCIVFFWFGTVTISFR